MRRARSDEVDEQLNELEHNIKRLRIEFDKYFVGTMKRPPQVLQGKVNKTVAYFSNKMPRNTAQKFRFNQLNSRYQMYRQHWGRVMRQIEAGTYKSDRFKAALHDRDRFASEAQYSAVARIFESGTTSPRREKWVTASSGKPMSLANSPCL